MGCAMSVPLLLLSIPAYLLALTCHEVAHGYVAKRLGDPTAELRGRLTLNPLKHIDPFGTIIFPALLWLFDSPVIFGWAKPVPIDPRYFRKPLKGMMWVGLAGPVTNFLLAAAASLLFRGLVSFSDFGIPAGFSILVQFLIVFILLNLVLGLFNLIPIPPLDGSRIVTGLLPRNAAFEFMKLERYGFVILFALLYLRIFSRFFLPIAFWLAELLTGFRLA